MEEREGSQQDKTEEATEERRRQYREEGQVASPREILSALTLIMITIGLAMVGSHISTSIGISFNRAFAIVSDHNRGNFELITAVGQVVQPVLPIMLGAGFVLTIIPSILGLTITQFNWSWKKITPNAQKLDVVAGFKRLLSAGGAEEAVKVLVKGITLCTVIYYFMKNEMEVSEMFLFLSTETLAGQMFSALLKLLIWISIASAILAAADYGWNLFRLERQMMMSKQEVKEENKAQEGDPLVRSQRRRMARELIMRKNIAAVPTATFVITNPTHFSVAIRYVKGMPAPIIVAKGQDFLALKIREIAKKNDIMLVENKALARTLYKTVKVGQEVPPSLYSSIIEVMKVIYQARGRDYFERFSLQSAVG